MAVGLTLIPTFALALLDRRAVLALEESSEETRMLGRRQRAWWVQLFTLFVTLFEALRRSTQFDRTEGCKAALIARSVDVRSGLAYQLPLVLTATFKLVPSVVIVSALAVSASNTSLLRRVFGTPSTGGRGAAADATARDADFLRLGGKWHCVLAIMMVPMVLALREVRQMRLISFGNVEARCVLLARSTISPATALLLYAQVSIAILVPGFCSLIRALIWTRESSFGGRQSESEGPAAKAPTEDADSLGYWQSETPLDFVATPVMARVGKGGSEAECLRQSESGERCGWPNR